MSGILRLANTGAGTGRSTLQSAATGDVTFNLPNTGSDSTATILTSELHSITSVNWDGMTINITNADFNVDNGTLFVDESTNRVGIGTSTPGAKLDIENNGPADLRLIRTNSVSNYCSISATGGNSEVLTIEANPVGGQAGGYINFKNNNSESMRIDASGRLLVGTTSARSVATGITPLVQVESISGEAGLAIWRNQSTQFGANLFLGKSRGAAVGSNNIVQNGDELGTIYFNGADGVDLESRAALITARVDGTPGANDMPGRLVFSTTADGASTPTERMRISNNGNVGINLSAINNNDNLTVGATVNNVATQRYVAVRGKTGSAATDVSGFACLGWSGHNAASSYTTNSVTAFSAQSYGLGTNQTLTNLYGFFASSGLSVATNNYGYISNLTAGTGRWNFYANGTASNYFAGPVFFQATADSVITDGSINAKSITNSGIMRSSRNADTELAHIVFYNPNGGVGSIKTSGNATLYNTSSDYRLKENITPIEDAADRVKALKPCRFNFKSDADKMVDGFLAHEAQEVVPEAVTGTKDGEEMQAMDAAKLVPLLTAALQEALTEISELKERVKNLEG